MLAQERKDKIIEIVQQKKIAKVSALSQLLNATEATIRRDLDELQENKKICRVHGGAILMQPTSKNLSEAELSVRCPLAKQQIAKKAHEFINDNDAIIIDASSTCLALVHYLSSHPKKELTVITNSFKVISFLIDNENIELIHTGGQASQHTSSTYGIIAARTLSNLRADKCFIGATGISSHYGYSDPNLNDCILKELMIHSAKQSFILADHTKFNESFIGKFADFKNSIDYLITDDMDADLYKEFTDANVNVVLAG